VIQQGLQGLPLKLLKQMPRSDDKGQGELSHCRIQREICFSSENNIRMENFIKALKNKRGEAGFC
jgi:hypothetical protein